MRKDRLACPTCASTNQKDFHCASCINSTVFDNSTRTLQAPRIRKEVLSRRLHELLHNKDLERDQKLELSHHHARLQSLQRRVAAAKLRLQQGQQLSQRLTDSNTTRSQRLELAQAQLKATRADVLESTFPTIVHYQSLTHTHVQASLLREAGSKILDLLEIFPISYAAIKHGSGPPERLLIRNLQLPENPTALIASQQPVEEMNAALGYLLQFMELLPRYIGGPLLHEAAYQASTSRLWQPQSFWDRTPLIPSTVLNLHSTLPSSNPISSQLTNISSRVQQSTGTLWRFPSRLYRAPATPFGGPSPLERQHSDPALPARPAPPARSLHLDARGAYEVLTRSISCQIQDRAHELKIQLPPAWPPLACMILICTLLRQEMRPDDPIGAGLGGSILLQATRGQASVVFNNGYILANDDDADDDDIDGWDVVTSPAPPPPSQPDEVEHWTRAMYTDAQDSSSTLPQPMVQQVQEGINLLFSRSSTSSTP